MIAAMPERNKKLLGAMIALGRAVEGNKNKPDQSSHAALLAALSLIKPGREPGARQTEKALGELREAKMRLVPRCGWCPKQCGRNDEVSAAEWAAADSESAAAMELLLAEILSWGASLAVGPPASIDEEIMAELYEAFYWLGKHGAARELDSALQKLRQSRARLEELLP